jgi:hypothetical protein
MIGNETDIGREKGLVAIINGCCDIRPPQKGLPGLRSIVKTHTRASIFCTVGRSRMPAFHPCERVMIRAPHRNRTVGLPLDTNVGRNVAGLWCCGQLNSTPPEIHGPSRPTREGLIYIVPVKHVVICHFVVRDVKAPAKLRQDHQAQPLVLKVHRLPFIGPLILADAFMEWQGISLNSSDLGIWQPISPSSHLPICSASRLLCKTPLTQRAAIRAPRACLLPRALPDI